MTSASWRGTEDEDTDVTEAAFSTDVACMSQRLLSRVSPRAQAQAGAGVRGRGETERRRAASGLHHQVPAARPSRVHPLEALGEPLRTGSLGRGRGRHPRCWAEWSRAELRGSSHPGQAPRSRATRARAADARGPGRGLGSPRRCLCGCGPHTPRAALQCGRGVEGRPGTTGHWTRGGAARPDVPCHATERLRLDTTCESILPTPRVTQEVTEWEVEGCGVGGVLCCGFECKQSGCI